MDRVAAEEVQQIFWACTSSKKSVSETPFRLSSPPFAGAIAVWEIQRPFRLSISTSP